MAFLIAFLTLLTTLIILITFLYKQKINSWKRKNIEILSNWDLQKKIKKRQNGLVIADMYQRLYNEQKPYAVIEILVQSVLFLQDLEMIKDITITHFDAFPDRGLYRNHKEALSTNLIRLDYELWRPLRQKLTQVFTAAKMKYMFPTLLKVGDQFVDLLTEKCEQNENLLEINELCARFTTDIIGNVAFGIECNSLKEPNTEFRRQAQNVVKQYSFTPLLDSLGTRYSKLFNFFNVKVFSKELNAFFTRLVTETIEYREKHQLRYNDFLDILIELKNNDKMNNDKFSLTLEMIIGQVFSFFVAGSDSSSRTMAYALYELAKNPDLQDKARSNIQEIMKQHDNTITYDNLQNMSYLKQVLQETLRKYPIAPAVPRVCRKQCVVKTSTHSLTINPGTTLVVPIYGIHHNPDYYSEPEVFKPERFDPEEVAKRPPLMYLPFGAGPRTCIAERFAKMQSLMGMALLLSKFKFSMTENTPTNLEFDPGNLFSIVVKDGIFLKVEKL